MENLKDTIPSLLHCPAFDFLLSLAIVFLAISTAACCILAAQTPTPIPPLPTPPPFNMPGERQLTDDPYFYESPVWSPGGEIIAVKRNIDSEFISVPYDRGWEIVLIDVATAKIRRINLGDGSINIDPTWSPDGKQLAFMSRKYEDNGSDTKKPIDQLTIYTVADNTWHQFNCKTCSWPYWLGNGTILVTINLSSGPSSAAEYGLVWIDPTSGDELAQDPIVGIIGGRATSLDGEEVSLGRYFFSPDGNTLLMEATYSCSGIWKYDIGTEVGPAPYIDSPDIYECDPAWSWDGTKLAYTVKNPFSLDPTYLTIANADGSNPENLIEPQAAYYHIRDLAWSPDSTQIAFVYGIISLTYSQPSFSDLFIVDVPEHLQPKSE